MENASAKVRHMDEDRLSMVSRMSQAVKSIPRKDFQEIKSFSNPPVGVQDSLYAVLVLLGYQQTDVNWKEARKLLGQIGPGSLQEKIAAVDPESLPEDRRKNAMAILTKYDVNQMNNVSVATASVYEWARAVSED